MNCRILQFAKAPINGEVKTRLIPTIGAEAANQLHQSLIECTLRNLTAQHQAPVELWVSKQPEHTFFQALSSRYNVSMNQQQGDTLGDRMGHAMQQTLDTADAVIIVGSDCPAVDAGYLEQALKVLAEGQDLVLGPADDGGYVLIGARRFDPQLMQDIDWGTERVLRQTRERVAELGWTCHELPMLWDVDRPEDLAKFEAYRQSVI